MDADGIEMMPLNTATKSLEIFISKITLLAAYETYLQNKLKRHRHSRLPGLLAQGLAVPLGKGISRQIDPNGIGQRH